MGLMGAPLTPQSGSTLTPLIELEDADFVAVRMSGLKHLCARSASVRHDNTPLGLRSAEDADVAVLGPS